MRQLSPEHKSSPSAVVVVIYSNQYKDAGHNQALDPLVTFVFLFCRAGGLALRMRNFEVPLHVPRGESTTLRCEFDLQGERLYSVKWYKGGREFFRHVPNEQPKKQVYKVTGVNVDVSIKLEWVRETISSIKLDGYMDLYGRC